MEPPGLHNGGGVCCGHNPDGRMAKKKRNKGANLLAWGYRDTFTGEPAPHNTEGVAGKNLGNRQPEKVPPKPSEQATDP